MYAFPVTLTGILAGLTIASPVQPQARNQTPYFEVRNFTFSKSDTSSRYSFSIDFPQPVTYTVSDKKFTIPGFTTPIPCTGTYFFSPDEVSTVTPINACGAIGDGENSAVTTKLDVDSGDLYMAYVYNTTMHDSPKTFRYTAIQTGLSPVDAKAMEGFNTPASGGLVNSA